MRIISATWAQINKIKITNNIMMNEMVIKNKMQRNNNGARSRSKNHTKDERKKKLKIEQHTYHQIPDTR